MSVIGGIELGGTHVVCAYATHPMDVLKEGHARLEFDTGHQPQKTVERIISFFEQSPTPITAMGISCFGPLDLKRGVVTTTPKQGWAQFPLVDALKQYLPNTRMVCETDVNGAVWGEWCYGNAKGLDNVVYVTVGTGIGGGVMVNKQLIHGLVHTEIGHIPMKLHPLDAERSYYGYCPYHHTAYNACLEGLAAGNAIKDRWGWDKYHPSNSNWDTAWEVEAFYLAQMCMTLAYTLSTERIILGGGVIQNQPHLLPLVHHYVREWTAGYIAHPRLNEDIENYIVMPALGDDAGLVGALALVFEP